MKYIKFILILTILAKSVSGQNDPEALKILERFSSTSLSAPSVSMKFSLVNINNAEGTRDTLNGNLIMSKDQYRLEMPDNITWFNGSTSWNYLPAEKEVTITRPDRKNDSFMSRPSSIFTLYKKGYKIRLLENAANSWTIDLYPEDIANDMVRIRLKIAKNSYNLINAEYKRKDGQSVFVTIQEYNLKIIPDASAFVFNPKNYKDVEIIDMR